MKKRIFTIFLIFAFGFVFISGCGLSSSESEESTEAETTAEIPQEAYDDVIDYLTDGVVSANDVVYTVNGEDITAAEFFYWLTYEGYVYSYSYYSSYYYYPDLAEEFSDGTTMAEYVIQDAYYYATLYACVYANALAAGVTLTDTYQESLDSYISDAAEELGQDEMDLYLMFYSTTEDGLYNLYLKNYYYQQYEDVLFGTGGEYEVTDEDIEGYITESEAYSCRYLLFGDPDGDISDEDLEEYYEEALACYEALTSVYGDEFDELFAEYAEDNPDGNTTGELSFNNSATVLDDFLEALESIEVGEGTMTGATEDGYYIIIRDEVTADTELSSGLTVLEDYVENAFSELVSEWVEEMEVVDTGVLDDFDVNSFFTALEELRALIDI